MKRSAEIGLPMKLNLILLWERHLAAMIVAGSHSHKGDTSLPTGWHSAPQPAFYEAITVRRP
jgi:hypothetical protein